MKIIAALFAFLSAPLLAQRTIELKGSIGYTGFADEGVVGHLQTGGSARIYLTPRFSVEPEFQYLKGSRGHYDVIAIPNVNWDFRTTGRVIAYVTGGVGWMYSRDRTSLFTFSHSQAFVQVGAGTKLRLNDRWYVAPEFRVGTELHARASVALGYTFRR